MASLIAGTLGFVFGALVGCVSVILYSVIRWAGLADPDSRFRI